MRCTSTLFRGLMVLGLCFILSFSARAIASVDARDSVVDGLKLHYLSAGHGPAVILLHGYAETSRMWKPIMPLLAEKFMVIAPDLPGIGDSGIPADGMDMVTAAVRIHSLARSLGVEKAEVVGHDIGLMVAYAYAARFPSEVTDLQQPRHVAFPFQWADSGSFGEGAGEDLFRTLLE